MARLCATEGKRGRPSKGDRKPTMVRLPLDFHEEVVEIALREGLPVTAVVTRFVAHSLDKPVPEDCLPRPFDTQTELSLRERVTEVKRGRPPRGDRKQTMVRLPRKLHEAVVEIAGREGLPVTAVVTRFVAHSLDKPVPEDCVPRTPDSQQELPLTKAS